jgi:hypothetical protein
MPGIFISYRRDDTGGHAGRLHERLVRHFGQELVFMDIDDIPAGQNFVEVLADRIRACDVLVVLIGKRWLTTTDKAGRRRLDDPSDFVRLEISTALQRGITVIPVLVGGSEMPAARDLPGPIERMAYLNACEIYDRIFDESVSRLIAILSTSVRARPFQRWRGRASGQRRRLQRRWVSLVVVPIGVLIVFVAARAIDTPLRPGRDGDSILTPAARVTLPLDLPPSDYVSELPAVIAAAAGPTLADDPNAATGPRTPRVGLKLSSRGRDGLYLEAVGGDGTLYVSAQGHYLWAVRNGRLQWGHPGLTFGSFKAALDGRVWYPAVGDNAPPGVYFNRDGQGGQFRGRGVDLPSLVNRGDRSDTAIGTECRNGLDPRGPGLEATSRGWFVPLDQDCVHTVVDSTGVTYVQTATTRIYAISPAGATLWTYAAPCKSPLLMVARVGNLILSCQGSRAETGSSLYSVRDGKLLWQFKPRGEIDLKGWRQSFGIVIDRTGMSYFTDVGDRSHLYAVDDRGRLAWTLDLGEFSFQELQLDRRGRLFLSGTFARDPDGGSSMTCIADSGC